MSLDASTKMATKSGELVRTALFRFLGGKENVGWTLRNIINAVAAVIAATVVSVSVLVSAIFNVASQATALFLSVLGDSRKDNQDALNATIAAAMTDLLAVDVTADDIPAGGNPQQQLARAVTIGGKLHDLLIQEFTGAVSGGTVNGEKAARAFTGFNISFATSAAVLSIVTELGSLGFFKQFREVGEEMAQALGLGRLHRQAMRPLIDVLVTKPYTRQLNSRYTPNLLKEAEYVKALSRGTMTEDQVNTALAELGYSADLRTEIIAQHTHHLTDREVFALVNAKELDPQRGLEVLVEDGIPEGIARLRLRAIQIERTARQRQAYLDELLSLAKDRFIPPETFSTLLDRVGLADEEAQVWRDRLGLYLDSHHKRLTFAQIEKLLVANQVNLGDFKAWADAAGYDDTTELNLEILVLLAEQAADAKKKAAAAKAAGKKPPPPPGA